MISRSVSSARTDTSFRSRQDPDHHRHGSKMIQLERLPINIVDIFTIDMMHCFCKNVISRFVHFLVGTFEGSIVTATMSEAHFKKVFGDDWRTFSFPAEFNRRTRHFSHFEGFKATEMRMFGLYGMELLVRKHCQALVVQQAVYCLCMGMRIICDPRLCQQKWKLAEALFDAFLTNCANYFGEPFVTLAIHHIRHLPAEAHRLNATSETFSCFKFENALKSIKFSVKSQSKPMMNMAMRLSHSLTFTSNAGRYSLPPNSPPIVSMKARDGNTPPRIIPGQFNVVKLPKFKLSMKRQADTYFSARGRIRQLQSITVDHDGTICLHSKAFQSVKAAYYVLQEDGTRINSDVSRVYEISQPMSEDIVFCEEVYQKYVVHKLHDTTKTYYKLFAYPMLHTFSS
jgi:hypothetical protein